MPKPQDSTVLNMISDDSVRHACGVTLQAISQRSPDVLKRHSALALPLTFLAMHEKKKKGTVL